MSDILGKATSVESIKGSGASMCNSKAQGGRRCAAHTFPAYKKHMEECQAIRYPSPEQLATLLRVTTAYASTPKGSVRISEDLDAYINEEEEDTVGIREVLIQGRNRGIANMALYREKEIQIKMLTQAALTRPRVSV